MQDTKVIAIANQKGVESWKTTTTLSLGVALKKRRKESFIS